MKSENKQDKATSHNSDFQDFLSVDSMQNKDLTHIHQQYQLSEKKENELIFYNHLNYGLYALGFITGGLSMLVAIFMSYHKRHEADGTWIATHFDWQIKTFWYSFLVVVFALFLTVISVSGFVGSIFIAASETVSNTGSYVAIGSALIFTFISIISFITFIWYFYRIIRGWIALTDKRPPV